MARHLIVNLKEPTMSNVITPTPGRVVWYWPSQQEIDAKSITVIDQGQPLAATVAFVWGDRMVNLSIVDQAGAQFRRTSVQLLQEGDERPHTSETPFAEWMPYQRAQHEKQAADAQPLPGGSLVAQVMADAKQLADVVAGLPPEASAAAETKPVEPAAAPAPAPAPATKKSKAKA